MATRSNVLQDSSVRSSRRRSLSRDGSQFPIVIQSISPIQSVVSLVDLYPNTPINFQLMYDVITSDESLVTDQPKLIRIVMLKSKLRTLI
jgi:hypothetical protein